MNLEVSLVDNVLIVALDDIRDPREENWNNYIAKKVTNPKKVIILWAKNYEEFTSFIDTHGLPDIISFDHDLAWEHYTPEKFWNNYDESKKYQDAQVYTEKTGLDCAKWLIEYCMDNKLSLPHYHVHSWNPVGADNIKRLLTNFIIR